MRGGVEHLEACPHLFGMQILKFLACCWYLVVPIENVLAPQTIVCPVHSLRFGPMVFQIQLYTGRNAKIVHAKICEH